VKFLFDHDVPDDLSFALESLGHEVTKVREVLPAASPDEKVLAQACADGRVLITCNRDDFLQLATQMSHAGIIVLIRRKSRALERSAVVRLLDRAGESGISGNINFA
jgi:predicted nuclease of predicted toxin-antitoxin system